MELSIYDILTFIAFVTTVVGISVYVSRKEKSSEDYFLAGRSLTWWLIGFSLIASNISTEHFVGQAGKGYDLGLAIASWEWMAAVTLVIVAIFFLPKFLKAGIYTMPEYLEYRYNHVARAILSILTVVMAISGGMAMVLYSGAIALQTLFGLNLTAGIWLIGIIAGSYTIYGGLKAVVWSDLFNGIALLLGGVLVLVLGMIKIGGISVFLANSGDKLHAVLPWNHPEIPWTAVFIGGLWIPNIVYWGLYQYITQRTLGAKSLAEGQKGILLAAFIKLFIPFIVVFPGIIAFEAFRDQIAKPDMAYAYLLKELIPIGLRGFMFAALFGAIVSSLDSLFNSTSTLITMDLYKRYWNKNATQESLMKTGRWITAIIVVSACLWTPIFKNVESIFMTIQEIGGFFSPGIAAAFLFGLFSKRTPSIAGILALALSVPIYGLFYFIVPDIAFLHRLWFTFLALSLLMATITWRMPLRKPVDMPTSNLNLEQYKNVKIWGIIIVALTVTLYVVFW